MFGKRLKLFRKKFGLTQTDLAKVLNKSMRTIQDWEGNKHQMPFNDIKKISEIYGINEKWLLLDEGEMLHRGDKDNYQSITGSGNIQVNSGSVNQSNYNNISPELRELFDLFVEFPIPSLIQETKEKLLKYKNIK